MTWLSHLLVPKLIVKARAYIGLTGQAWFFLHLVSVEEERKRFRVSGIQIKWHRFNIRKR